MMKLEALIEEAYDSYDGILAQKLDFKDFSEHYSVYNMWECPEDATIQRELVSAEEIVDWIRFGIELAQKGYDDIEVSYKASEE